MTIILLLAGAIGLFAFLYRCRGGGITLGNTQLARVLFWALPIAIGARLVTHSPWVALACGVAAFCGLLIPHGKWIGQGAAWWPMGLINFARAVLILLPVALWGTLFVLVASIPLLLSGLGYALGWRYLNGRWLTDGAAWGEVFSGFLFGVAFGLAGWVA